MGSAIVRQWHLLTLLPMGPRRIDAATLEEMLRSRGLHVHRRTIQRDLIELGAVFPIVSDDRSRPYGWRWADDAELRCPIPAFPRTPSSVPEVELRLSVSEAALRAVLAGLRGSVAGVRVAGGTEVRALVGDGSSLRRWLFGFGDALEVLAPADLRSALAEKAARTVAVYTRER